MTIPGVRLVCALLVGLAALIPLNAAEGCAPCLSSRYWAISPDAWRGTTPPAFPEMPALNKARPADLGVTFSGGGTRAATASVGQLRALARNGWLQRVRYIGAVSGGSWTTVPFTFSTRSIDDLLGPPEDPKTLTLAGVKEKPKSLLLQSVVKSRLAAAGLREGVEILARERYSDLTFFNVQVGSLFNRFFGTRSGRDQTFADMLGRLFINPAVEKSTNRFYTWNDATAQEFAAANRSFAPSDFVQAVPDRPFLIVGGTVIYSHEAYDYPKLIPIEYTPLYTGVRQQFGGRLGGAYVWPLAYDAEAGEPAGDGMLRVVGRGESRRFTLSDLVATSGAAPLLALYLGRPSPRLREGAGFFPTANHVAIRGDRVMPAVTGLSHGDGGFTDNLGLMPLLARQVRNIIVFVNADSPFDSTVQLESLFFSIEKRESAGDRSMNVVFAPARWDELRQGLRADVADGAAAVYCGRGWEVKPNETYNVQGYSGLNICFVYNHASKDWEESLTDPKLSHEVKNSRRLRRFPWFRTFEENLPNVIRLNEVQTNLLANLAEWSVVSSAAEIAGALEPLRQPR